MLFHEEEEATYLPLSTYWYDHEDDLLIMTYEEGDTYLCSYEAEFESDNGDEFDMDEPGYDEFNLIIADVEEILANGPNKEDSRHADGTHFWSLLLTYKHFPVRIATQEGEVIYERDAG